MKLRLAFLIFFALAVSVARFGEAQAAMTVESNIDSRGITFGANSSSPTIERMRITQGGLVGISTTTPLAKLDVNGTISASDAIQVSGSSLTCSSAIKGAIRYSTTSNTLEYCNSVAWTGVTNSTDASLTAFSVTKTAAQTGINAGTVVTWEAAETNNGNGFDLSTERFVAPANGYYYFIFTGVTAGDTTTGNFSIYKNGSTTGLRSYGGVGSETYKGLTAQGVLYLAAGDYVDVRSGSASLTLYGQTGASVSTFSGFLLNAGGGSSGGSATPAGSTADVQYNSAGALAADTGNFTYASGLLKAPTISATTISGTYQYGQYASVTTIYNPGSFSGNTIAANSVSSTAVSATNISTTIAGFTSIGTVANLVGGLGNSITSGSASVSTTSGGSITFYTGGNQRMVVGSSGNVGIGATLPSYPLEVSLTNAGNIAVLGRFINRNSTVNTGAAIALDGYYNGAVIRGYTPNAGGFTGGQFEVAINNDSNVMTTRLAITKTGVATFTGTSTCTIGNGTGATNCTSDERLKQQIVPIDGALDKLMLIRGVTFHWKKPGIAGPEHIGVIAQNVEKAFPQAVDWVSDTTIGTAKTVDYAVLVAPIIEAIREFKGMFDTDHAKLEAANENISHLQQQLDQIKQEIQILKASSKNK